MKKFFAVVFSFAVLSCSAGNTVRIAGGTYEHTFRWYAPEARKVCLAGEMCNWSDKALPMTEGRDGCWTLTLLLEAGKWQYKFVVDGAWTQDTNNPAKTPDGFGGYNSLVTLGAPDLHGEVIAGNPHGTLTNITIRSAVLQRETSFNVYLPPDALTAGKTYPVLFLLHGYGEDENQWARDGGIANYMDNFIAEGAVEPFMIVMPSGGKSFYTNKVEQFIVKELYPYVVSHFPAKTGKANTAVAGASMGGFGAFNLTLDHPGTFGLAVSLSGYFGAGYLRGFDTNRIVFPSKLVIYCGTNDTLCFPTVRALTARLDRYGVPYEYRTAFGGHTWRYWNGITRDFLGDVSSYFYPR